MAIKHATTVTTGDGFNTAGRDAYNADHVGTAGDGGFAFKYLFDTGVWASAGDNPTTGKFKMNAATPEATTLLVIYETDASGTVLDPVLDLVNPTDFIMLSNGDKSIYHVFSVPLPFVSGSNIDSLPVRWMCGTGNAGATTQFANGETVFLTIQHADFDDVIGCAIQTSRARYYMYA